MGKRSLPLAAAGIAAAMGAAVWCGASRSDAFRVTAVQLPLNSALKIPESVIGQNLWAVDLNAVADGLKRQQPFLKRVRVVRSIPNTLRVETVQRMPVAQVSIGAQWYAVDADGFILAKPAPAPADALVILKGVEPSLKPGREQANDRLLLALRMVEQLKHAPVLIGRRVTTVNVSNPKQLAFMLDQDVEIRCGDEGSLSYHLQRLRTVLRRVSRHQLAVRSIDLRFKDPVVIR
ncbi:MAG: FtsQ-type POTRA domain-containing protein [Candidatus Omnitrophica bacterium]|nr:FtsQ-type POTRA domain-containing protein [Candidatus Omnitrophota bacterium]